VWIVVDRLVPLDEEDHGDLVLNGAVHIRRTPPIPCFVGDPPPCP
jgi:hypothetical protein